MSVSRFFSSLFTRFFISLLLVSLIPVTINFFQLWQAESTIQQKVEREIVSSAELIVADVNHWVDLNLRSSNLIAKTTQIKSMAPLLQVPILEATDKTFDWSYAAFTTDLEGNAISRSDAKPLKFYGDREYVKTILSGEDVGQQVLISRVNGKPALCLSVPIMEQDQLKGTLVQCSKLVNISESVASVKIGETGLARLVDSKRRLIAHGDPSQLEEDLKDLSADPITLIGNTERPIISTLEGKKVVSYSLSTNLDWQLTVIQDYDDAYAVLHDIKKNALIAGGLLLLGILLMAFLLGNSITKPIKKLAVVAETYSKGAMQQDIPGKTRNDEIGELARAIERLGHGVRVMMNRYQQLKKKSTKESR